MVDTTHLFCPTMHFSLPNPDFCCHSLYSIFIYCLPSTYTIVESNAICHFLQQFFEPLWLNPIFLLFQTVCSSAPPARLSCPYSHPIQLGASFVSHPSWCFVDLCLPLWVFFFFDLFFSLEFKITSTAKALPPFSARNVLRTLDTTQC